MHRRFRQEVDDVLRSSFDKRSKRLQKKVSALVDANLKGSTDIPPPPPPPLPAGGPQPPTGSPPSQPTFECLEMSFASASASGAAPAYDKDQKKTFAFLVPGNEELYVGGVGLNGAVGKLLLENAVKQPIAFERDSDGDYVMVDDEDTGRSIPKFNKPKCLYRQMHLALYKRACSSKNKMVIAKPMEIGLAPFAFAAARVYSDCDKPFGTAFLTIFKPPGRPYTPKNAALLYIVETLGRNTDEDGDVVMDANRSKYVKTSAKEFLDEVHKTGANAIELVIEYNATKAGENPNLSAIEVVRLPIISGGMFLHPDITPKEVALVFIWGAHSAIAGANQSGSIAIELMPEKDMQFAYELYREGVYTEWNTEENRNVFYKKVMVRMEHPSHIFRPHEKFQEFERGIEEIAGIDFPGHNMLEIPCERIEIARILAKQELAQEDETCAAYCSERKMLFIKSDCKEIHPQRNFPEKNANVTMLYLICKETPPEKKEPIVEEVFTLKSTLKCVSQSTTAREKQLLELREQRAAGDRLGSQRTKEAAKTSLSLKKLLADAGYSRTAHEEAIERKRARVKETSDSLKKVQAQAKHYRKVAQKQHAYCQQTDYIQMFGGEKAMRRHPAGDITLFPPPTPCAGDKDLALSEMYNGAWGVGSDIANPYACDSWPFEPNVLARRAPQDSTMQPFAEETEEEVEEARTGISRRGFGLRVPPLRRLAGNDDSDYSDDDKFGRPTDTARSL